MSFEDFRVRTLRLPEDNWRLGFKSCPVFDYLQQEQGTQFAAGTEKDKMLPMDFDPCCPDQHGGKV